MGALDSQRYECAFFLLLLLLLLFVRCNFCCNLFARFSAGGRPPQESLRSLSTVGHCMKDRRTDGQTEGGMAQFSLCVSEGEGRGLYQSPGCPLTSRVDGDSAALAADGACPAPACKGQKAKVHSGDFNLCLHRQHTCSAGTPSVTSDNQTSVYIYIHMCTYM